MSDPDDQPEDPEYSLVLPFVSVASKGGPYEDEAFTAGWACGQLDAQLHAAAHLPGVDQVSVTIQAACREQADLVAMHHGWVMETVPFDESVDEGTAAAWVSLRFRRAEEPA